MPCDYSTLGMTFCFLNERTTWIVFLLDPIMWLMYFSSGCCGCKEESIEDVVVPLHLDWNLENVERIGLL